MLLFPAGHIRCIGSEDDPSAKAQDRNDCLIVCVFWAGRVGFSVCVCVCARVCVCVTRKESSVFVQQQQTPSASSWGCVILWYCDMDESVINGPGQKSASLAKCSASLRAAL